MPILGIDPDPLGGTWVLIDDKGQVIKRGSDVVHAICAWWPTLFINASVAIEMPASYGMAVGVDVFETCEVVGRLHQSARERDMPVWRYYRNTIKNHLCHASNANDANIRQSLIDRYGPGKELAIGKKSDPGPLYGFAADDWAALAVAVTHLDRQGDGAVNIEKELARKKEIRAAKARKRAEAKRAIKERGAA